MEGLERGNTTYLMERVPGIAERVVEEDKRGITKRMMESNYGRTNGANQMLKA
ncbi:hypothetical protein PVK06_036186 [Gossypium arboreum]|uniref:Uncharacterized protein n=1 Tax=Gossypium arboreum TaxID=29729 RepID=A0ABR0NIT1_GOSAR|nr:hypothetical protein PVK06_036186 [Gossypium arboreum]